ncbi:hypothetical protein TcCL_Unassigned00385 [Trypanosoma cruzi]|nr:hypothetical protein TcCL_Unassigned00385 [Trypanosoma cruzi]
MRRGQQAQPHSSHTTRRHPRKEGTQRQQPPTMQEEKTSTTISIQLISTPKGKQQKRRGHHTTHTERAPTTPATCGSESSSISDAAENFPAIPPSMGHGAQLSAVTRGASHPQENRLGLRTPPSLLFMATEEDNSRHTQLPACTAKGAFISTAMCILWLCGCVCLQKHKAKKIKKGPEHVEGRTKMYSGGAWRKQQQQHRSNS